MPHCLNGGGHGLLKSTTGKPEGPYEPMPDISKQGIDAHLYQEEDGTTYYAWGADRLARMSDGMKDLAEEAIELQHDGQHPLGYEGVLLLKIGDKYLHIASGRYGYEPGNTYDLYYAVSDKIMGPYGKRRMAVKNAGHGNLFEDKQGRWWSTAFDHDFRGEKMERWSLWLVPVEIEETADDVRIHVKDERFRPTTEDQEFVDHLARTGQPEAWDGKAPGWRPED